MLTLVVPKINNKTSKLNWDLKSLEESIGQGNKGLNANKINNHHQSQLNPKPQSNIIANIYIPTFWLRSFVHWGSEYQTSLVFTWSKWGWMPNGPVFKGHLNSGQRNHWNTGQMEPSCFIMYWSGFCMVSLVHKTSSILMYHFCKHACRAKMLCMLTKMIHKYTTRHST